MSLWFKNKKIKRKDSNSSLAIFVLWPRMRQKQVAPGVSLGLDRYKLLSRGCDGRSVAVFTAQFMLQHYPRLTPGATCFCRIRGHKTKIAKLGAKTQRLLWDFEPLRLCVKKAVVGWILLVFLFSGCMMGPNYRRPCLDIPDKFYESKGGSEEALDSCWWQDFEEPVLDDLISEALMYNNDLRIAAANIEIAAGIFVQARAPFFPQVGYAGNYTRLRQSQLNATPAIPPNPQANVQVNTNLSWELDIWGRVRRLTESAQASLFATVEARENVILSLIASVANGYLQLLGLDAQLLVAKETQTSYENALKYFELQYKHGQVSNMIVAQAKVQYEIATASIPQIELQIAQAEHAISVLLGRNPGPIARGKPIYKLKIPEIPADLPSSLLERRPDILQAEQNLIAANAQIGAAKALYFPAITLTGAYGVSSKNLSDLFKGPAKAWNYTGSITGPIFTWGTISGQVEEAEGQKMAALYNYKLTIQEAFREVEDALIAYTKFTEKFAAQQRLVEAAREYVNLSKLQYDGGYSPYFVVLQAEQQLFPSELSWIQTRVALFSSSVDIYQSMGGGLTPFGSSLECSIPPVSVF